MSFVKLFLCFAHLVFVFFYFFGNGSIAGFQGFHCAFQKLAGNLETGFQIFFCPIGKFVPVMAKLTESTGDFISAISDTVKIIGDSQKTCGLLCLFFCQCATCKQPGNIIRNSILQLSDSGEDRVKIFCRFILNAAGNFFLCGTKKVRGKCCSAVNFTGDQI